MSDPIPNDTPARRALIDLLKESPLPLAGLLVSLLGSPDQDDAALAVHYLDAIRADRGSSTALARIIRPVAAEIHATLRARGLEVSSRGKLVRVADEEQLEERARLRREAGPDPDARHDDHERGDR